MKNTFSLFGILLSLLLTMAAANRAEAQRFFDLQSATTDTLTNQDTIIYTTTPVMVDVPYYYSIHVKADSISGANAGTAYLQFSNHRSGTVWYNAQTMTIDGTGTDEALYEGILYARRVRVYFITPSGTRKVKPSVHGVFKRLY